MKSLIAMLVALSFGCGLAAAEQPGAGKPAAPAPSAQKEMKKEAPKPKTTKVVGTVESVDPAALKIVVKLKDGALKDVIVAAATKITKGKKKAALADIMAGDSITVTMKGEEVAGISFSKPKPKKETKEKQEKK